MEVKEGVLYRLRDGRMATIKKGRGGDTASVMVGPSNVGSVWVECGKSNRCAEIERPYDIVSLWEDKNPDGTYYLPDEKVSLVWENAQGGRIMRSMGGLKWVEFAGGAMVDGCRIVPGRWLPWTPPAFPARKKTPLRRAKVFVNDIDFECVALRGDKSGYEWVFIGKDGMWNNRQDCQVEVLEWLDPEYEDELGATDAQPTSR